MSEVKNQLNYFKVKVLEEMQILAQEIKVFARNDTEETSTIANNVNNNPNSFTPFMRLEPHSSI